MATQTAFREQAQMIVAVEDGQESTLLPIDPPDAEPAEVLENLGEFPILTDQDEGKAFPSHDFIPEKG